MQINEAEKKIYGKLYDITADHFDAQYGNLRGSKETFLASLGMEANRADLGLLDEVPAKDFLETAFITILKRWPEDEVIQAWDKRRSTMGEVEYKNAIISTVVNSRERAAVGVTVTNNHYVAAQKQPQFGTATQTAAQFDKLYRVYMKFPKWVRKLAKKALR